MEQRHGQQPEKWEKESYGEENASLFTKRLESGTHKSEKEYKLSIKLEKFEASKWK